MKFTLDEIRHVSESIETPSKTAEMLRELARRLRQEAEEGKRDVVKEPRPGDRIEFPGKDSCVWWCQTCMGSSLQVWILRAGEEGATIIPRREVKP